MNAGRDLTGMSGRAAFPLLQLAGWCLAAMLVCGACGGAWAQKPAAASPVAAPEAGEDEGGEPPVSGGAAFMAGMNRLSAILGSVHFLRTLCGDEKAGVWRQKMDELIAAQAPNEADRKSMIASFNSGYRGFEATYRKCTPAARIAVRRYQDEGVALAREISARYGN